MHLRYPGGELMHGDCLELMASIPDGSVDLILCDLPYGTTACKWDTVIPFEEYVETKGKVEYKKDFIWRHLEAGIPLKNAQKEWGFADRKAGLWTHYKRIAKPNAAIVLTASQPFTSALVMSNPRSYKHGWAWNKRFAGNFATAKYAPMKIHEDVLVFSFGAVPYCPQMTKRDKPITLGSNKCASESGRIANAKPEFERKVYTEKFPESILVYPRERGLHPTQKPVALMEYLIRTYSNEGETVMDNCMGSGTTGVACANTNRRFIGVEKDPTYFAAAARRIVTASKGVTA